jgi:peptidyl-prolyl cis-trans isomerase C
MCILHIDDEPKRVLPNIFGRRYMKYIINRSWIAIFVLFTFVLVSGCGDNDKNKKKSPVPALGTNQIQPAVSGSTASNTVPIVTGDQAPSGDIAVSVDGKILKKSELGKKTNEMIKKLKDKIPADKQKDFREDIKKQLVNTFVIRTLLANEIEKRKIEASDQEIKLARDKVQASLPPGKKIDEFFKEKGISKEEITFAVKIEKFRNMEIGNKAKPSQKEIAKFYNDNRDKLFVEAESVHVRHILVATKKDDDDKVKAQKKEKIENLRKQLLNGGNFAELARKNSDCPSKEAGGDLNFIKRGQTVKPFEDAAFSQQKDAIGPVITTEYGYHIIQVLDRKPAKKIALEAVKDKISAYLDQKKKTEAFDAVLKNLQQKAKIIVY